MEEKPKIRPKATEGPSEVPSRTPSEREGGKPKSEGKGEPQGEGGSEVLRKTSPERFAEGVRCEACGSNVTEFETPTGKRYRCPQCKALTKVVREGERPLEPPERPSTSETKVSGKPIFEKITAPSELAPPMPPELQFSEYVSEKLATELRQVFGIKPDQAVYIARTVKDNPQLAQNPNYLAYHIKQLAAKANDYQLQYVLTGIYERMKAESIPGAQGIPPIQFSAPTQPQHTSYPPLPVQQPLVYQQYSQGNPWQPARMNPQGQGSPMSVATKEDVEKTLKNQGEEFQRRLDERDRRNKEGREKDALIQTLDGVNKALDNLHIRISDIEKGGVPRKSGEEENFNKTLLQAIGKDISARITGVKGELTPEKIRLVVGDEVKKHFPSSPSGTRNQFDMEVEKANHESKARMIEAEERRKGYEAIAGGLRDGFNSAGWNIGAGISGGTPKGSSVAQPATEPQPMEWKDGLWHTRCVYEDCRAPMVFEDGKSTVACGTCGRVVRIQPTEEEIREKGQEVKKPEVKKPQVERPAEEELPERG